MSAAKTFVVTLAATLSQRRQTMSVPDLAARLNAAGIQTSYGTPYAGGRGSYRLVNATYDELVAAGRQADADVVAEVFTKPDGTFAYDA